jgi:hypothetical protein
MPLTRQVGVTRVEPSKQARDTHVLRSVALGWLICFAPAAAARLGWAVCGVTRWRGLHQQALSPSSSQRSSLPATPGSAHESVSPSPLSHTASPTSSRHTVRGMGTTVFAKDRFLRTVQQGDRHNPWPELELSVAPEESFDAEVQRVCTPVTVDHSAPLQRCVSHSELGTESCGLADGAGVLGLAR